MYQTLWLDLGKRANRQPELVATAGQQQLLHVIDSASGVRYLVDSGAQVSVVPFRSTKTPHSALLAADGRKIPTWGVVTTNVVINGHRYRPHKFVKAAVDKRRWDIS